MTQPTKADWHLFVPIVLVVFAVDLVVGIVLSALPPLSVLAGAAVDALAVTIVAGPLLWRFVVKRSVRNAEVEALRADARVATILATSIDGIITADAAGVVSHFNAGAEKIFGYAASEVIGRNISLLIPEQARAAHARHLAEFGAGGDASRAMGTVATLEGRRKSGEQFPVDVSISKLGPDGDAMLTAVVRDVSGREKAESSLREAVSLLRAVLNNAPITIWATDAAGVFTLSDGRGLALVGLKPGENIGVRALDLYGDLRFVDHAGQSSTGRDVLRRAFAGETVTATCQLGETFYENHIGPQRAADGTVVGIVGVAFDITERIEAQAAERSSEQRFRVIFDGAPLGIALIDTQTGRFLAVNPQYARIAGRTIDELMRLDWMSITHPDDVLRDHDNMMLLNAGKIPGFQMEKRYVQPDGTTIWVKLTIALMPGDGDATRHRLAMAEDITERKHTEELLMQNNERLQSLSSRLLDIQETERRQLAMELHDEIGQALTAAKINLQSVQRLPRPGGACDPARRQRAHRRACAPAGALAVAVASSAPARRPGPRGGAAVAGRGERAPHRDATWSSATMCRSRALTGRPRSPASASRRKRSTTPASTRAPGTSSSSCTCLAMRCTCA